MQVKNKPTSLEDIFEEKSIEAASLLNPNFKDCKFIGRTLFMARTRLMPTSSEQDRWDDCFTLFTYVDGTVGTLGPVYDIKDNYRYMVNGVREASWKYHAGYKYSVHFKDPDTHQTWSKRVYYTNKKDLKRLRQWVVMLHNYCKNL